MTKKYFTEFIASALPKKDLHRYFITSSKDKYFRQVRKVKGPEEKPCHELHSHDTNSLYTAEGLGENLEGLIAEIKLGNNKENFETFNVKSPFTVYIPVGVYHSIRFIEGKGIFANIIIGQSEWKER